MLNIEEINEEIKKLEESECTTYSICQKLASLYIVKDHLSKEMSKDISNISVPSPMIK